MTSPLRCHLLIGPPASGKTTLAHALAPLLSGPGEPPAAVLSTDRLRAELFGDAAVQGPWGDIEALLHERIRESVAAGVPVIVDATHARRPWRLAITQALELPAPVEWIGWWLTTPLAICLAWNQNRERRVPETVIQQMDAALWDASFKPSRAEGLAAVVAVNPMPVEELEGHLRGELRRLEGRIRAGRNRESQFALHGYSRLLDLERLLYLLRLLSAHPDLSADDPASRAELEMQVFPLPEGDLPERAAVFLHRLHGPCYGDASAIAADLAWLQAQASAAPSRCATRSSRLRPRQPRSPAWAGAFLPSAMPRCSGGCSPCCATCCSNPSITPRHTAAGAPDRRTRSHPGSYISGEAATLRKDIERLLTPYGFRARHHNVRHGYSLGTALLSARGCGRCNGVVREAVARLADPTAQDLLEELEQRLQWGGIAIDATPPVRAFANRSIVSSALVRDDSLAVERQAEQLEAAIVERRRLELRRYDQVGSYDGGPAGTIRAWPLQLLFHNIGWYLVYEEDTVGLAEGLIRTERLDRLALRRNEQASAAAKRPTARRCSAWLCCCATAAGFSSATTWRPSGGSATRTRAGARPSW